MKKVFILIAAAMMLSMTAIARPRTLWMVGDATMAQYSDSVEACGWVQMLQEEWAKKIIVVNDAAIESSARGFMEGDGVTTLEKKPARTIMFVQFGTNDLKEYNVDQHSSLDAFNRRLIQLIDLARKNRVNVVLCTPLAQPYYHNGELIDRLGAYAEAIRRVAQYQHVALIDLEKSSREWLTTMTEEEAAAYYVTLDQSLLTNGEYQLNQDGAKEVAQMVKLQIKESASKKLRKILKK